MAIHNTDKALLAKIKEVLGREDTVLFIGAGLSRWSGLPSWTQLLEELAEFIELQGYSANLVKKELDGKDLLQAASYGVDQLTPPQFGQFIRQACRVGMATPHEVHRKIIDLGPTSFITTNYDRLIEESLTKWRSDIFFQIVSNKQLTETADIVQARAKNFIFKPHGDVGDVDSIILSREQYRILYTDRKHILQALETLLVSRPIVFIGFGLRDIDFFYIKDLLASTYKGGTIDHYAIMADVSDQERNYWRKNYGVHILPYHTIETPAGGSDHTPLLFLLDELMAGSAQGGHTAKGRDHSSLSDGTLSAGQILALARYASRLISSFTLKTGIELPLQISIRRDGYKYVKNHEQRFDHALVEVFLTRFDGNALLIGNPGAGKTYSFKKVSLKLAREIQSACLSEPVEIPRHTLPIYVDLKLYKGSVWQLAEQSLPPEISLEFLIQNKYVRFYLDSFNEMPREHFESGDFEQDFNEFNERVRGCPVLIGSRTDEGLQKFNLPTFWLDEIDREFVKEHLRTQGDRVEGRFEFEITNLLQKPLFFKLYLEGRISINDETHPHHVYSSLFQKFSSELQETFGISLSIETTLASIAFSAIEEGRETLIFSDLLSQLKSSFNRLGIDSINETDFINWLISREILIPASGKRLTFFHQSITEYLAAMELANLYKVAPQILDKSLKFTRWDQTIFLALGFLSEEATDRFIQQVFEADFQLAIRAAKFVEFNRDLVVSRILQEFLVRSDDDFSINRQLPITKVHVELLKELATRKDYLGGVAVYLLASIPDGITKEALIEELFNNLDDYNYGSEVGHALANYLSESDLESIVNRLGSIQIDDENYAGGLNIGLENAFKYLPWEEVVNRLLPWGRLNEIQLHLLRNVLRNNRTDTAISLVMEMLIGGVNAAAVTLYFQLTFLGEDENIDTSLFNKEVVTALINMLDDKLYGWWAANDIKAILAMRPDLTDVVYNQASQSSGIIRLVLLYSLPGEENAFWTAMKELPTKSLSDFDNEPLHLLKSLEKLDWSNNGVLLASILKLRHSELTRYLLDSLFVISDENEPVITRTLIEPIDFWLEWLDEESSKDPEESYWFCDRLANFLVNFTSSEVHSLFINEFNKNGTRYRPVLSGYILHRIPNLTSDMLGQDALQYLITLLSQNVDEDSESIGMHILGMIATESFIQDYLLPLLSIDTEPLKSNLRESLRMAGHRHRRRYISEAT